MINEIEKYKDSLRETNDIPNCIPSNLLDKFENPWELMSLKVSLSQYHLKGKFDISKTSKDLIQELKETEEPIEQLRITLLYIAKTNPLLTKSIKELF